MEPFDENPGPDLLSLPPAVLHNHVSKYTGAACKVLKMAQPRIAANGSKPACARHHTTFARLPRLLATYASHRRPMPRPRLVPKPSRTVRGTPFGTPLGNGPPNNYVSRLAPIRGNYSPWGPPGDDPCEATNPAMHADPD